MQYTVTYFKVVPQQRNMLKFVGDTGSCKDNYTFPLNEQTSNFIDRGHKHTLYIEQNNIATSLCCTCL